MGRIRWVLGAMALVLAAAATACGAAPTSTAPSGTVTLVGGVQSEVNWWFPTDASIACGTFNATTAALLYRPLLYISNSDGINFTRSIASSISVSQNDTVFTVHLNPRWHWSNGKPVTSADAAYSFDIIRAANQPNAPWQDCFTGVGGMPKDWKSVTTPNPNTLVITTSIPVNPTWFEHNGIAQLIPIPKAVWDKHANMNQELTFIKSVATEPSNPVYDVVDGPYKIGTYVNDEYWTLLANPKYDGGTRSTIKQLVFDYETSESSEYAAIRKKTFATATLPSQYAADRATLVHDGYTVTVAPYSFCFNYMVPNLSAKAPGIGGLFQHLYIRKALQMGINQPAIVKDFYYGLAVSTYGPVPSEPPNQYYDPHITKYPYNLAAGKRLLEAHGWKLVNGVMEKNGQQLAFDWLIASGDNTVTNIAQLVQSDWAKEGIRATIKQLPFNQVVSTIATPSNVDKWDLVWWGGGYCYIPNYYPLGTDLFTAGGGVNFGGYSSPRMDGLLKEAHQPASPARSKQILDAYQEYAASQLPVLYVPSATSYEVIMPTVHGVNADYNPITTDEWFNRWTLGS